MNIDEIVNKVTERIYADEPALLDRFGEQGKAKCREDNHHHMRHLQTAVELNEKKVFTDYALWLDGILTRHGMSTQHLIDNFEIIQGVLEDEADVPEQAARFHFYLSEGISALKKRSGREEVEND